MNVPDDLYFSDSHEWVDPSSPEAASVGISDHAQAELTDVVYLELPEVGRTVSKGEAVAVIESVKAANDIYAPVSGEIVEVNEALADAHAAVQRMSAELEHARSANDVEQRAQREELAAAESRAEHLAAQFQRYVELTEDELRKARQISGTTDFRV